MADEEVRFYRLASLLFDSNGSVLQGYLKHLLSTGSQTLQQMLSAEKHNLFHNFWKPQLDCRSCINNCNYKGDKRRKSILTKVQWDTLYVLDPLDPCHALLGATSCPCQYDRNPILREEDMDVTLITFLLLNIFSGLHTHVIQALHDLRSARNELSHSSKASLMLDDTKFNVIWNKSEPAILTICSEISHAKRNDVHSEITTLKSRDMDARSSTSALRILKVSMAEVKFATFFVIEEKRISFLFIINVK